MDAETCWTLIRGAAAGETAARAGFVRRYLPVVQAYLRARWQAGPFKAEIEDTAQEVFVDCFREGGILERAEPERDGGFRAFLYGIVRRSALKTEERCARRHARQDEGSFHPEDHGRDDATLSAVFDRAWALALIQAAGELHLSRARAAGAEHVQRVELLRLRFQESLPIREIARLWDTDAAHLHREYSRARHEFGDALSEVVREHQGGSGAALEQRCEELLALIS